MPSLHSTLYTIYSTTHDAELICHFRLDIFDDGGRNGQGMGVDYWSYIQCHNLKTLISFKAIFIQRLAVALQFHATYPVVKTVWEINSGLVDDRIIVISFWWLKFWFDQSVRHFLYWFLKPAYDDCTSNRGIDFMYCTFKCETLMTALARAVQQSMASPYACIHRAVHAKNILKQMLFQVFHLSHLFDRPPDFSWNKKYGCVKVNHCWKFFCKYQQNTKSC